MEQTIDSKIENFFPPGLVIVGYVFMLFSLISIIGNNEKGLGIGLALLGILLSFTTTGVRIDKETKKYLSYNRFFGFEIGKWKSMEGICFLSILTKNLGYTIRTKGQLGDESTDKHYEIYLLNENHRFKLLINRTKNKNKSIEYAKKLEEELGFELVIYSPK